MADSVARREAGSAEVVRSSRASAVLLPVAVLVMVLGAVNLWDGSESDRPLVAVVFPGENRYFDTLYERIEVHAEHAGVDLERLGAGWSGVTQIDLIREVALQDPDVIAFSPVDRTIAEAVATNWKDANPDLFTFLNGPSVADGSDLEAVRTYVGVDNRVSGRLLAEQVLAVAGDEARILLVEGDPQSDVHKQRRAEFDALAAEQPHWQIVERFTVEDWRLEKLELRLDQAILEHQFDIVAVEWGDGGVQVSHQLKAAGLDVPVVSNGWSEATREAMNSGLVQSTTVHSIDESARQIVATALAIVNGETLDSIIEIPQRVVEKKDSDVIPTEL